MTIRIKVVLSFYNRAFKNEIQNLEKLFGISERSYVTGENCFATKVYHIVGGISCLFFLICGDRVFKLFFIVESLS